MCHKVKVLGFFFKYIVTEMSCKGNNFYKESRILGVREILMEKGDCVHKN